ncbi:MAG: FecR domain-containing protein [Desulfobaccales bacterium]
MQRRYLAGLLVVGAFALGLPLVAQAVPVGRFVQVEGSVDLMRGGKAPAVPVKVQDEVEQGDAVRTKSLSKAQIHFVDDTVLDVAPESRVAIDEYVYDAAKGKRQAVVEIFRGLVHFAVNKIAQNEKPDFIMKTHTGVLGVRGTAWYAQLNPLNTDIYNERGITEVQNLFQEVPGKVTLTGMEFTRVGLNLPPTLPLPITQRDMQQLWIQFRTSCGTSGGTSCGGQGTVSPLDTEALLGGGGGGTGPLLGTLSTQNNPANNPAFNLYTANNLVNNPVNNPNISTSSPGPISSTYNFAMDLNGYLTNTVSSPGNATQISGYWGQLTGVDPEYFTTSGSGTRASASFSGPTGSAISLTASDILTGTVSGVSGQSLSGTYSANFTTSNGYSGTFSGPITINPNGTFSYSYTNLSGSNSIYTETGAGSSSGTPGTYFTQTAVGSLAMTGNTAGNQQTLTNLNGYSIWGTRTGVLPGQFAATINMTSTAPVNRGYYPPADQSSLTASMQGVVSGAPGGPQTGVMTTVASGQNSSNTPWTWTLAGPVTINPNGGLSASFYGTNTDNGVTPAPAGTFTQQGTWTQTAATLPAASTYSFSIPLTDSMLISPTSTTQATVQTQGFGTRSGVFPGTYLDQVNNGTLSGNSSSFTVGNNSSLGITGTLSGTVSGVLGGYTLTGTGSYNGTSGTGQIVKYTGPITISPNGQLTFNYTGTVTQGATILTAAGTMTEQFGPALTRSASGTYQVVSGGSGAGTTTLLNNGQMTGSQIVSGVGATATNGSLALTYGHGTPLPGLPTGASGSFSTSGAGANGPILTTRLTRLTGISLGSRIMGMSHLIQPGTSGNPALAANLRAFRRFRQQQRLAALHMASGPTPGGRTPGNPAGPIPALQKH